MESVMIWQESEEKSSRIQMTEDISISNWCDRGYYWHCHLIISSDDVTEQFSC